MCPYSVLTAVRFLCGSTRENIASVAFNITRHIVGRTWYKGVVYVDIWCTTIGYPYKKFIYLSNKTFLKKTNTLIWRLIAKISELTWKLHHNQYQQTMCFHFNQEDLVLHAHRMGTQWGHNIHSWIVSA